MGPSKKKKRGFLDGCAAGIVKLTTTMPLDTIKVQMQLRKATDPDYGTMASSARAIVRGHGMAGLYTGLSASLVNQGGKTGIQFAAYQFWPFANLVSFALVPVQLIIAVIFPEEEGDQEEEAQA